MATGGLANIKNRLLHLATRHRQGPLDHVFICSVPRSGSTWLAELIATQGRFKLVNEPFNLRVPTVVDNLGIGDWGGLLEPASKPAMRTYLQRFVDDLDTDPRFKREMPFSRFWHLTTDRMLFKILFAGEDDLDWFRRELGGHVIFLLRHPIPVSLSREELPRLESFLTEPFASHFTSEQRSLAHRIIATGDRFQMAVLDWCLQNAVPLRHPAPRWLVLSYEQMVTDPETVVHHLSRALSLPRPRLMLDHFGRLSASTTKSSRESRRLLREAKRAGNAKQQLVTRWRDRVSAEQASRAFDILEAFGIDYYARDSAVPDARYLLPVPRQGSP